MQNRLDEQNHYEILGLAEQATEEQIRTAYKTKARQYHPDKNASKDAEEKFKEVSQAYSVLHDKIERRKFDAKLKASRAPAPEPTSSSSWSRGQYRHMPNPTRPTSPASGQHRQKDNESTAKAHQSRTYTVRTNGMFSPSEPPKVYVSREDAALLILLVRLQIQLQRQIQLEIQRRIVQQVMFDMVVKIYGLHHHIDNQQNENVQRPSVRPN
jgi:curved DNA-binding protein CbpA